MLSPNLNLALSSEDLANLVLQRTGAFIDLGGTEFVRRWIETGEKAQLAQYLVQTGNVEEYLHRTVGELFHEFTVLKPFFEETTPRRVVGIGPGLALTELMIYGIGQPRLVLIDVEATDQHQHLFHAQGSGYSSLESCRRLLTNNGVDPAHIAICNPRRHALPEGSFDAITSLLSMGFHFPCDEYAGFILAGLRPGGLLILDKRKKTEDAGWEQLRPHFDVRKIIDGPKAERLILARK